MHSHVQGVNEKSSAFDIGTKKGMEGFSMRTTVTGIVGGTASSLGGGKFSNGALSGAFVHMFNAEGVIGAILKGDGIIDKIKNFFIHSDKFDAGIEMHQIRKEGLDVLNDFRRQRIEDGYDGLKATEMIIDFNRISQQYLLNLAANRPSYNKKNYED